MKSVTEQQLHKYQQARMAKDRRFDGLFFVCVKTTGIFCRPVCTARAPLEKNVTYLQTSAQAIESGFRPCLMCRPDSAPGSFAWQGVNTTVERAVTILANQLDISIEHLSQKLGISPRYLAKLFEQHLQISPKRFQLTQRILFAKKLLHETSLSIELVAQSAGFASAKRLQHHMRQHISLSPSQVRKSRPSNAAKSNQTVQVFLSYRTPYSWEGIRRFFELRQLQSNEIVTSQSIAKCIIVGAYTVNFVAKHVAQKSGFEVCMLVDDVRAIKPAMSMIRKMLDLDADPLAISKALSVAGMPQNQIEQGIRLPGIIDKFEGACRAVVGQQVSVKAAIGQLNLLNATLNEGIIADTTSACDYALLKPFLTPSLVASADVSFLKMPNARKQTLTNIAMLLANQPDANDQDWLNLKGIGPWTVNYVKLRHADLPDVFLDGDLIIKQQMQKLSDLGINISPALAAPYRSYLTLNLWNNA